MFLLDLQVAEVLGHMEVQLADGGPAAPMAGGLAIDNLIVGALVEIGTHLVAGAKIAGAAVQSFQYIPAEQGSGLPVETAVFLAGGDGNFGMRLTQVQQVVPVVAVHAKGGVGSAVGIHFDAHVALVFHFGEYIQEALHAAVGADGIIGLKINGPGFVFIAPHGHFEALFGDPDQLCKGIRDGAAFGTDIRDLQGILGFADGNFIKHFAHKRPLLVKSFPYYTFLQK